jgi:enamine deaminase RidA (YjgF/YER057c/UK114 family)
LYETAGSRRVHEGLAAFQQAWNPADPPPAITVHVVAGLGPEFLVEIDAVAVV